MRRDRTTPGGREIPSFLLLPAGGLAALFLALGLLSGLRTYRFVQGARSAEGVVVGSAVSSTFLRRPTAAPVVEFQTPAGEKIRFEAGVSTSGGYRRKARVRVLFDPSEPTRAKIDDFTQLWLFPSAFASIGAFGLLVVARRLRKGRTGDSR